MYEPWQLFLLGVSFALAGVVKGISGLGLPAVSLVLMTFFLDFKLAVATVLVPALLTNIWQAINGGAFTQILKRLWSYFIFAAISIWIGVELLLQLNDQVIITVLGGVVLLYALSGLWGWRLNIPRKNEKWASPVTGILNGIITGLTGTFMIPAVIYFQGIGFDKNRLVQSLGMFFSLSSAVLIIMFSNNQLISIDHVNGAAVGIVGAFIGLYFGEKIRHGLNEVKFRKLLFYILAVLGSILIFRATYF